MLFIVFVDDLLLRTFAALLATFFEVYSCFAMCVHLLSVDGIRVINFSVKFLKTRK